METYSQELIDKWNGGKAILFDYGISHGHLRIVVSSDSKEGCLAIQCIDAEYIRGKTRWLNCNLKIESVDYRTEFNIPICYVIKDEKAGFEVHCGTISTSELSNFNDLMMVN